jgi:hypothetical protein
VHGLWTVRAAGAGPHAHDAFLLISAAYMKTDKTSGAQQPVRQTRVLATHRELEEVSSRWGPVMGPMRSAHRAQLTAVSPS